MLEVARERDVRLGPRRGPDREISLDAIEVEDGDRDGMGGGDGVAQVDERVHARQVAMGADAAKQ